MTIALSNHLGGVQYPDLGAETLTFWRSFRERDLWTMMEEEGVAGLELFQTSAV
jgi:hypothetical protein